MNKNVSGTDRYVRSLFAVVFIANGLYFGWIWMAVVGALLGITAIAGRCLVYMPFHISTCEPKYIETYKAGIAIAGHNE